MTEARHPHLSPEAIAAYVDRVAPPQEQKVAEEHLRQCPDCRRELAAVARVARGRLRRKTIAVTVPIAAAAVLALVTICMPEGDAVPRGNQPALRAVPMEGSESFDVVAPADMENVSTVPVEFVWRSVAPDAYYKLTVTDADGDVIWAANTGDTVAILPGDVVLSDGQTYYWYVDALLERGESATTGVSRFSSTR